MPRLVKFSRMTATMRLRKTKHERSVYERKYGMAMRLEPHVETLPALLPPTPLAAVEQRPDASSREASVIRPDHASPVSTCAIQEAHPVCHQMSTPTCEKGSNRMC